MYLFQVQMESTNSNNVAKNLVKILNCLPYVLDNFLKWFWHFLFLLFILKIRFEQWFLKLVSVLVTFAHFRTSTLHDITKHLDGILVVRLGILTIEKGEASNLLPSMLIKMSKNDFSVCPESLFLSLSSGRYIFL